MKHRRLQEMDHSGFEVVKGEPDIRGWDVKNMHNQKIGEVEDLIVDAQEKKVRYLVVDLDDNKLNLDHRKVLVPIGLAELDEHKDDVLIPNVSPEQFAALPPYDKDHLTPDVERRISSTLDRQRNPVPPQPIKNPERKDTREQERKENKGEQRMERNIKEQERKNIKKEEKTETTERNKKEEIDPDFYRHENYNLDNLYKNRLHEARPVKNKNESEYETGLRLWERRSEGGTINDDNSREKDSPARDRDYYRDMDEETRKEMIKSRRNNYEQRRYADDNPRTTDQDRHERSRDEDIL